MTTQELMTDAPRWFFASISKHFEDTVSAVGFPMFVEGENRDTSETKDFFELRIDGPWFTELSKDYHNIYIEINILIQSAMDETNYHRIHQNVGIVAAALHGIQVFKYGTKGTDDDSLLGCMEIIQDLRNRERIQVYHFGQVGLGTKLTQSVVEGHLKLEITTT